MRSPVVPALAAVDAAVAVTFRRLGPAAIPVQDRLGIGRYPDDINASREQRAERRVAELGSRKPRGGAAVDLGNLPT
jgi:hypothetical protein